MKKTVVTHLTKEYEQGIKTLVGIKVQTEEDTFVIPVVDVRHDRGKAEFILKSSRAQQGSRFMKPSYSLTGFSYQVSRKK